MKFFIPNFGIKIPEWYRTGIKIIEKLHWSECVQVGDELNDATAAPPCRAYSASR